MLFACELFERISRLVFFFSPFEQVALELLLSQDRNLVANIANSVRSAKSVDHHIL